MGFLEYSGNLFIKNRRSSKQGKLRHSTVFDLLEDRRLLAVDVFLDFGVAFEQRLDEITGAIPGFADFSSTEIDGIENDTQDLLETMYDAFDLSFLDVDPPGTNHDTIEFGETTQTAGLLGDSVDGFPDFRNQSFGVVQVFTANHGFTISGPDDSSKGRTSLLGELTASLSRTAAHELGHSYGLLHWDSYGDSSIDPNNTGEAQNSHVMATGSTGINTEPEIESAKHFSDLSLAKLEYANGLLATTKSPIPETGTDHDSAETAQPTGLGLSPVLSVSEIRAIDVVGSIDAVDEIDYYSFTGREDDIVTVNVISSFLQDSSIPFDAVIELRDDEDNILASSDLISYDDDSFGSPGDLIAAYDGMLLNYELPEDGEYYFSVSEFNGTGTGDYELFAALDGDPFVELDAFTNELSIFGDPGFANDNIVIDMPEPGTYEISVNGLAFEFDSTDIDLITVDSGDGNDVVTVLDTADSVEINSGGHSDMVSILSVPLGTETTVSTGSGNDSIVVGAEYDPVSFTHNSQGSLDKILGTLDINGGSNSVGSEDEVNFRDIDSSSGTNSFIVEGSTVSRTSAGDIELNNIERIDSRLGDATDLVYLRSTIGYSSTYFNSGGGNDIFYIGVYTFDLISGDIELDGASSSGVNALRMYDFLETEDSDYEIGSGVAYKNSVKLFDFINFDHIEFQSGTGNNVIDITSSFSGGFFSGNTGNDTITGSAGKDLIVGDGGDDIVYGGGGDDELYAGKGSDTLYGGDGNDILYVYNFESAVVDYLFGGDGTDEVIGELDMLDSLASIEIDSRL